MVFFGKVFPNHHKSGLCGIFFFFFFFLGGGGGGFLVVWVFFFFFFFLIFCLVVCFVMFRFHGFKLKLRNLK